ncbi:MAG TPA: coenzyme F420-0:L-glutamate ligase [Hyphomicrobiaceae bacterium]|jgi:coenzyme F420-0:L-glutamate ligase/coenzyme F420-1:gamma-L-glutamate ligase|nr:coenzyme F420-0:L-glutamate ligase [Hyphomicrobiaceae bacterium]
MGLLPGTLELSVTALTGLPEVAPGADLAGLLIAALNEGGLLPRRQDILVVTQKVVSKAEGRYLDLDRLAPSRRAEELARITGKDARLIEAVLSQADEVLRAKRNVLIVATGQGLVIANAGIDQSNLTPEDHGQRVLLLPEDADLSAGRLKARLDQHFQCDLGLIISDSAGRAWRLGTVGIAIGAAGVPALLDRRGEPDRAGRPLEVTEVGFADAVAAMAVLAMGEAAEARPAALVRGLSWSAPARPAAALVRPKPDDMFR